MARAGSGSITGTGTTTPIDKANVGDLSLSGTFVATVELQREVADGVWITLSDGSFTEAGDKVMRVSEPVRWRLNCTSYTSGTITWYLNGRVKSDPI